MLSAEDCLQGECGVVLDAMSVGACKVQSKHACGVGKLKRLSTVGIEVMGDSSWRAVCRQMPCITRRNAPVVALVWLSAVAAGHWRRPTQELGSAMSRHLLTEVPWYP